MRTPSLLAPAALAMIVSLFLAGCGDDDSHLKELSRYTPENLSQELLVRYKAALRKPPVNAKAKANAKAGRDPDDGDKESAAAAKYGEEFAARDADGGVKGMSTEELAQNIAKKARLIEDAAPQDVLAKLVAAIDADSEIPPNAKEELKAALKAALGA
ncbi:hypothetical protein [Planctomyces sp. SH-PL62]|uniref:hypothetical protein n=1 Tax=Planctomyces sp. SH-PL62 TaxID=1636152 RepID=UPI00078BF3FF|nr:hypothetical protein [Planctomyces sp. SH-PL62]AMV40290.1 hypothetical protein VT85_22860 [Planctomyces sp. SH-PL62]